MRRQRTFIGAQGMAGMVSLWGASSGVIGIQRATISIAAASGSNTSTITAVNMANARLRLLGMACNNAAANSTASSVQIVLTNATTVTATRSATGVADAQVTFEVIEYAPGLIRSIQRGTITISGSGSNTAAITDVNTARTELDYLGERMDTALDNMFAFLTLTNATTVTAARFNAGGGTTLVSYQAVEWF